MRLHVDCSINKSSEFKPRQTTSQPQGWSCDMESVEGSALDLALDSLDMLSTVTTARRDYLNELKARGIRPPPSIRSRSDFAYASSSSPYGRRRKENVMDGDGAMQLYCASSPSKLVRRTSCKFRPTPYSTFNRSHCSSTKRKPLNALLNPVTSYSYFSTRTRASDSWSSEAEASTYKDTKGFDLSDPTPSSFHLPPMMARSKSLEDLPTTPGGSWSCPVDDGVLKKVALQSKGSEGVDESMSMLIEKLNVTS